MQPSAFTRLGRALVEADQDVNKIFTVLGTCLTESLCDGCSIDLEGRPLITLGAPHRAHHREQFRVPGELSPGVVITTRERSSRPFDPDDTAAIEACIEYASFAANRALLLDHEREASRSERDRSAQFHREMVRVIGHDLRAPIGAITLATEMLTSQQSARDVAPRIMSFARRLTRMLDQVLDMTRSRLGTGIPLARTSTRLRPLVRSILDDLAIAHPAHAFELDASADINGVWDTDRLSQVALNLLLNAVQYGREGGTIRVGVAESEARATLTVHNELVGAPIAPDILATLFEPYRRSGGGERTGSGLGLGLYIARAIVDAHGGDITVASCASGTTFRVSLPQQRHETC